MNWNNVKILAKAQRTDERLFLEACFTVVNNNNFNRCIEISDQYKATVKKIIN